MSRKTTYYLIHPSFWPFPHWTQRFERGGEFWFGNKPSGFPAGNIEIIQTAEVENDLDLDWSTTKYHNYKQDWNNGWLSTSGKWIQCDYQGHSDVAYYIAKSDEQTLEQQNYIKISGGTVFSTKSDRYTLQQINWLKKHGHEKRAQIFEDLHIIIDN